MMVRHVLGISGGKDSAALAIYMKDKYPDLNIEYYSCDTGKELDETYQLIENLQNYLGKEIVILKSNENSDKSPFDHKLKTLGGFLPSQRNRWCTKYLKLNPFEAFVGNEPVVSYVGIRGDENREGYISTKSNIQSIFPFRKNIWSEDVMNKIFSNINIDILYEYSNLIEINGNMEKFKTILTTPISLVFNQNLKLQELINLDVTAFNKLVFKYLQKTDFPLSKVTDFPLLSNSESLDRNDIFKLLNDSGVGVPEYYKEISFDHHGKTYSYARSRSGCYFCFYQQKIEWVWLYEQHPALFEEAMSYEKNGYTWNQEESLAELIKPERIIKIKDEYIKRKQNLSKKINSPYLIDILEEVEEEGCATCFI